MALRRAGAARKVKWRGVEGGCKLRGWVGGAEREGKEALWGVEVRTKTSGLGSRSYTPSRPAPACVQYDLRDTVVGGMRQ